jgi:hypothetical protein
MISLPYPFVFEHMHWSHFNFQESYHGKGPHDGIGAACKQRVWKKIMRGTHVVLNAEDFFNVLIGEQSEVQFFFVSSAHVNALSPNVALKMEQASLLPGIRQTRWAVFQSPFALSLYRKSFCQYLLIILFFE